MANVVFGETVTIKHIKRIQNSAYEYESVDNGMFKAKIVGTKEKRTYRVQSGVNGGVDSLYLKVSNFNDDIKVGDYIEVLGETKLVNSVGYFYEESNLVNTSLFSNKYIINKCPKGINVG